MTVPVNQLLAAAVAACICATAIGVYDYTVRQPRTPRLALIDIAKIYAAADQGFKARALEGQLAQPGAVAMANGGSPAPGLPALRSASEFGPVLNDVLQGMAAECRCAIVAMATVVSADSTLPDFTPEVARRMGLALREGQTR